MKVFYGVFVFILFPLIGFSVTADGVLNRVDSKLYYESISYREIMKIHFKKEMVERDFNTYIKNGNTFYSELISPSGEVEIQYLRLNDTMLIYSPEWTHIIKISGQVMKQSFMGSDLSYNDISFGGKLGEFYDAVFDSSLTNDSMYVLLLTARRQGTPYYKRKIFVYKKEFLIGRMDLYAKDGRLVREMTFKDYKKVNGVYVPIKINIKDNIRDNSYTELLLMNVKVNVLLPNMMFTESYLREKR